MGCNSVLLYPIHTPTSAVGVWIGYSNTPKPPTHYPSLPLLQPTPSPVKAAPQCLPIKSKLKNDNMVQSSAIEKDKLVPKHTVFSKYSKLLIVSKAPTLATKLAREAYFGDKVLGQCTVMGCRDHPGLPISELNELKQDLFNKFPQYWSNPVEFEEMWTNCVNSIGQACKRYRAV